MGLCETKAAYHERPRTKSTTPSGCCSPTKCGGFQAPGLKTNEIYAVMAKKLIRETQMMLRRNYSLVLDLGLDVFNSVTFANFQKDRLP